MPKQLVRRPSLKEKCKQALNLRPAASAKGYMIAMRTVEALVEKR